LKDFIELINQEQERWVELDYGLPIAKEILEQNPEVQKEWDPFYGDKMVKIVFIGKGISKEEISKELDEI
jgi:hypothetical protein